MPDPAGGPLFDSAEISDGRVGNPSPIGRRWRGGSRHRHEWPADPVRDHDTHECAEGDRCWRKGIHECWCGATIDKKLDDEPPGTTPSPGRGQSERKLAAPIDTAAGKAHSEHMPAAANDTRTSDRMTHAELAARIEWLTAEHARTKITTYRGNLLRELATRKADLVSGRWIGGR